MKTNNSVLQTVLVSFALTLCLVSNAFAESQSVYSTILMGGSAGSECTDSSKKNIHLLGETVRIRVKLHFYDKDELPAYTAVPSIAEDEVALHFLFSDRNDEELFPNANLTSKLLPEYFVSAEQKSAQRIFERNKTSSIRSRRPQCHWMLTIPHDFSPGIVAVWAEITSPVYGTVNSDTATIEVVLPCSKADEYKAAGTRISALCYAGMPDKAMTLADSLLQTDWAWGPAFMELGLAARDVSDFTAELRYLDESFNRLGEVNTPGLEAREEDPRSKYLELRQRILRRQQQHEN